MDGKGNFLDGTSLFFLFSPFRPETMLDIKGIRELEIWLKLFSIEFNAGLFVETKYKSLFAIATKIANSNNPSSFVLKIVNKAFYEHYIVKKDGFFVINIDRLADALADSEIYRIMLEVKSYRNE